MSMIISDDEYEMVPHKKVKQLKSQLETYKAGSSDSGKKMMRSMGDLTNTLDKFLEMLKVVSEELKIEEREEDLVIKQLQPLLKKMDLIVDQNSKIAQGIVVVVDMLKKEIPKIHQSIHGGSRPMMSPQLSRSRGIPPPPPPSFGSPRM